MGPPHLKCAPHSFLLSLGVSQIQLLHKALSYVLILRTPVSVVISEDLRPLWVLNFSSLFQNKTATSLQSYRVISALKATRIMPSIIFEHAYLHGAKLENVRKCAVNVLQNLARDDLNALQQVSLFVCRLIMDSVDALPLPRMEQWQCGEHAAASENVSSIGRFVLQPESSATFLELLSYLSLHN